MNRVRVLGVAAFLLLIGFSYSGASFAAEDATLVVLGSFNELKDERWKDVRIGFGLRNLITESFFETGAFSLVEEKEEIKARLRELAQQMWLSKESKNAVEKSVADVKDSGAKYSALGRVYYFGRPQTKVSVGVLQSRITETILRIEITLINSQTGKSIKKSGTGTAETTANSMVFQVRDDTVMFDETAVGTATKKAVANAIAEIMKDFRKIQ